MNMILRLTAFLLVVPAMLSAQDFAWAQQLSGPDYDSGILVSTDAAGNLYSIGTYQDSMDFDPGPGKTVLYSPNIALFIQKTDVQGHFLWVKQLLGTSPQLRPVSAETDAEGNFYLTVNFTEANIDADPGPGIFPLSSSALDATFLLKLDPDGNFVWARALQASGPFPFVRSTDMAFGASGAIYLCGTFKDTVDFDPGPGAHPLYSNGAVYEVAAFILKLDAAGHFMWAKMLRGGFYTGTNINSIALDTKGGLYCLGGFNTTVDFDPGPGVFNLTNMGGNDVFIQKLDTSGNFVWAKSFGGTSQESGNDLHIDASGNLILRGSFDATTDFNPGPAVYNKTTLGESDMFIEKLDADGNFRWVATFGGFGSDGMASIDVDELGNIFASGGFNFTVDFDPGPGAFPLTASTIPHSKGFLLKLDPWARLVWVKDMGFDCSGNQVKVSPNGHLNSIWTFSYTVEVNADPLVSFTAAYSDVLVVRYIPTGDWNFYGSVFNDINGNGLRENDEPGIPNVTLEARQSQKFTVTNALGEYHFYGKILQDTIWPTPPWNDWQTSPVFAVPDSSQVAMDFAASGPQVSDVCIAAVELGPFRPGFTNDIFIQITNVGTLPVDSIPVRLKLVAPSNPYLEYLGAQPVPVSQTDHQFYWLIPHLNLHETVEFRIQFKVSASIPNGTEVTISASAVLDDDANQSNNGSRILANTVGSFDPNDKQVTPAAVPPLELDTTDLRYVIRFQNTGTYPADFVIIRDTLPAGLDLATFKILAASHPYTWRFYGERILEFRFDPINLPDSTANEPESHGFVAFTVQAKNGLPLGTAINNRAGIYFDFNEPVITNTSVMTVKELVKTTSPGDAIWLDFGLNPNPVAAFSQVVLDLPEGIAGGSKGYGEQCFG